MKYSNYFKIKDLAIFLLSTYFILFSLNIFFHSKTNEYIENRITNISDIEIDRRHPYLVLRELNFIKPTITVQHPIIYLYREKDYKNNFFPLSGISNSYSLMCNENGYWKTVSTDKYGFNNTENNYMNLKKINARNVMIIGDSTSEGYCVNDEYLTKYNLEKIGFNVFNFAKGGNGPLIEYATLREYISIGEFETIIWAFYPNDLSNLIQEYEDSVLIKYLENGEFTQNIRFNQKIVDDFYINNSDGYKQYFNFINEEDSKKLDDKFQKLSEIDYFSKKLNLSKYTFLDLITLKALFFDIKSRINFIKTKIKQRNSYSIFSDLMVKTKKLTDKNNSKLLFVYLPSRIEILNETPADKKIIDILVKNKIDYIDMNKEIVGKVSYEEAYNYGLDDVHYNEKIYKLISDNIVNYFDK